MNQSRPVVQTLRFHLAVIENSLNIINARCWGEDDCHPVDYLDDETTQLVADAFERMQMTFQEIKTANNLYDHTSECSTSSDDSINDLVSV